MSFSLDLLEEHLGTMSLAVPFLRDPAVRARSSYWFDLHA